MKRIAIIGSTGSIGVQTLDLIAERPDLFKAALLAAGSNVDLLIRQAVAHRPSMAVIADESKYLALREALSPLGIETAAGAKALADAMERDDFTQVVTATVGYSGLEPTLRAIAADKDIALANKETLVVAGELVTRRLTASKSQIIPVDSEHSAIYQCLQGEDSESVERLIITASGGPFLRMDPAQLATATVAQALKHPNWSMGAKITIDSATMLNKAFEIIEARWLFGIEPRRISAVVHPQSIVHSMVEFADGAVKAQLGVPDMHLPIRYALADAKREGSPRMGHLTLDMMRNLTFEEPDPVRFPCLTLAPLSLERGGNTACVINAAGEVANEAFRQGRIAFPDIYATIVQTLQEIPFIASPEYADYVNTNAQARTVAASAIGRCKPSIHTITT